MNVKNGTEKCLDWIFKNNRDRKSFLATITQSTGTGKTYAIENAVCKQINANGNEIFFVVTNNKENRNEIYNELCARDPLNKDKILLLESDHDAIIRYFNFILSNETNDIFRRKFEILNKWKEGLNPQLTSTREVLESLIPKYVFNTKSSNDFFKLKYALRKDLNQIASKQDKNLSTLQDKLDFRREIAPWSFKMFPDSNIHQYQVIVLTMHKFIRKYNPILGNRMYFWNINFDNKKVTTFIDESDEEKKIMLDILVDQDESSSRREDVITLFKRVYMNLTPLINQPSNFVQNVVDERGRKNQDRFKNMYKKFKEVYDQYHLESGLRISSEVKENEINRFIFNCGQQNYLFNGNKQYLVWEYDKKANLNVLKNNRAQYLEKKEYRLTTIVQKLERLLKFFTRNMYSITKAVYKATNIHTDDFESELVRQLNNVLLPTQNEFLADYFIENFLDDIPNRTIPNIRNNFAKDTTLYAEGINVFNIISNEKDENVHVYLYLQNNFPEKVLVQIANHIRTILLSATGDNPSPISNFDLNWVKNNVKHNVSLSSKLEAVLDNENKIRNKKLEEKTNWNINEIGKSLITAHGTLAQVMINTLKQELNLELSLEAARELLMEFPTSHISDYERIGINSDMNFINAADKSDDDLAQNVSFNFARQLKWLLTTIAFYQNYQKHPYCNSYVIFTNVQLTDENNDPDMNDKKWLLAALTRLGFSTKSSDFEFINAQNRENIKSIKEEWGVGQFKILFTNREAFSRGINLSYKLSDKLEEKYGRHYQKIDEHSDTAQVDVTGIYEEQPSHLAVVSQNNAQNSVDDDIKFIYEQYMLHYSNLTDLTQDDIKQRIRTFFNHKGVPFWNLIPMKIASTVNVEQAMGRLCRNGRKADQVLVNLDYSMTDRLDYKYLASKRTNIIMEKILNNHLPLLEDDYQQLFASPEEQAMIDLINKKGIFLQDLANNLRTLGIGKQCEWILLREFIGKHPIIQDSSQIPSNLDNTLYGFYYQNEHQIKNYFYCFKDREYQLAFITSTEEDASQKLKSYKAHYGNNPLLKYHEFNLKNELSYLNKIFDKNPWIKKELQREGYDLDFSKKGELLLTPLAFNNLYKAAISEKIFEIVAHHYSWNFHSMKDLAKSEFELYDGFLNIQNSILYVDVKNYNSNKYSMSKKNLNQQVIKKEKERLGVSEGQAVVIVNLYQFESDMEYKAVRILDKIKSDGVYIYPALFDNDGTLNNDLIQDLGELTYGDNN